MLQHHIKCLATICLSLSCEMLAQTAIAQQSRSDSLQLEEIIVTAEKRESTVQTTPISLTAVTGADIQHDWFSVALVWHDLAFAVLARRAQCGGGRADRL